MSLFNAGDKVEWEVRPEDSTGRYWTGTVVGKWGTSTAEYRVRTNYGDYRIHGCLLRKVEDDQSNS